MVLNVRASVNPLTLQKPITAAIRSVNKDQAISDPSVDQIRISQWAAAVCVRLARNVRDRRLLLAGLGIYGVILNVAQRTREMGIRAALGATERTLLRLILDRGVRLTLIGLAIGTAGAIALTRLMAMLLFGVGARDPLTMVSVGAILASVAIMASYVPARRATRVDPVVALRVRVIRRSKVKLDPAQQCSRAFLERRQSPLEVDTHGFERFVRRPFVTSIGSPTTSATALNGLGICVRSQLRTLQYAEASR